MSSYKYRKYVAFYETDAMAIVHHSNYIRYLEEARVAWFRDRGLSHIRKSEKGVIFAVLETGCKHRKPARFDDEIEIHVQVRSEGAKVRFQYAIYKVEDQELIATGFTLHVPVDRNMKVCKIPTEAKEVIERESWNEIWP